MKCISMSYNLDEYFSKQEKQVEPRPRGELIMISYNYDHIISSINSLAIVCKSIVCKYLVRKNNARSPASATRTTGNNVAKSSSSSGGSSDPDPEPYRKSQYPRFNQVVPALSATFRINGGAQ